MRSRSCLSMRRTYYLFAFLGVLFCTGDAQEPQEGLVIFGLNLKKPSSVKCYCYSKTDEPLVIRESNGTNGQYCACEIVSKKLKTVELLVRSLPNNEVIFSGQECLFKKREESATEFWTDPISTFGSSTGSHCLLITDLDLSEKHTSVVRVLLYWLLVVILMMSTVYVAKRYDLHRRMLARWRLYRYRDETQEYVTFQR